MISTTPVPPGKRPAAATGTRVAAQVSGRVRWDNSDAFKGPAGQPIPKKPF
jgi:hypothetical protein